jgi:hypothetical protein
MAKIYPALMAVLLLALLLSGCSKTETVTVTLPAKTITITQTPPPPVTVTITQTPPPPVTVTTTAKVTVTPTWIPCIFRGWLNISYTGTRTEYGTPLSGDCMLTIDENGNVTGTFGGSAPGKVVGLINQEGNLILIGTLDQGGSFVGSTWTAVVTLTGKSLSATGDWTSDYAAGTLTGTGEISY